MYRANDEDQVNAMRAGREKRTRRLTQAVAASVRQMCEPLERRVMLSKARIVDAGDFYWYQNTQISLHRATDQVVVGYMPASLKRMTRLNNGLIAKGGALAGYQVDQRLNSNSFSFKRTARGYSPTFQSLQGNIQDLPAMKYFVSTFFSPEATGRIAVTDEIEVNLNNNVDPSSFFGTEFSSYRVGPIGVVNGDYLATLAEGGGLDVLALADHLHGNTQVEYATPNFVFEIVPSSFTPQDEFWNQQWNMTASHLPDAWDTTTGTQGSSDVVVAVFDDGVEPRAD